MGQQLQVGRSDARRLTKLPRFTLVIIALALGLGASTALALIQSPGKPLSLPVSYEEHRFYVQPVTKDGVTLKFYTDTGGGLFILREVAERLHCSINNVGGEGANAFYLTSLPAFKPEAAVPLPLSREGRLPVWAPSAKERDTESPDYAGMLGQEWFAGRVWTFDYPHHQLFMRASGDLPKQDAAHRVTLGFKSDETGKRALNFPRIQVTIDGESLDLLFDTGAMTKLSDTALNALKDQRAAVRATSFITTSIFEKWRKAHPDWRVIESADLPLNEPMIEVPAVTLGGYTVGPVWFTRRADKNFHEFMSRFMDKRVEGAIGGNALRHFQVTVDYPQAIAIFEK